MFGFCQNVEIIHQHHHHFYEYTMPMHLKNGSNVSKSNKANSAHAGSHIYNRKTDPEAMVHTSKIYHSRRSYLNKSQKGIEVLSKVSNKNLSQDSNNLPESKFQSNNAFHQDEQLFHPQFFQSYHQPQIRVINQSNQVHFVHFGRPQSSQQSQHQSAEVLRNIQRSAQQAESNSASQNSSSTQLKTYINSHKLSQSKLGYCQEGIYQTIKINRILPIKTENATQVKIPHYPDSQNQDHLFVRNTHNYDRDSILTKKSRVVNAMKSGMLFEQAKSIMSHESLQSEAMQIEQSIIVSRSMDYFCHITAERELGVCKIYLGMDCEVGLLVCIRLFQHRFQYLSFNEAELYNHLGAIADKTGISFGVLELYKTLVEGTGEHKNIYFVLQPYQQMLDQFIEKRRAYFRSVPMAFSCFEQGFQQQMTQTLTRLKECGLILVQVLQLKDIVLINNRFKLNSLLKMRKLSDPFASHNSIQNCIGHLKHQIEQLVNR